MSARIELFGSSGCPYTSELREHLLWNSIEFIEYDIEADEAACQRLQMLTGGRTAVPVLVEDGLVKEIGWRGRTCIVGASA